MEIKKRRFWGFLLTFPCCINEREKKAPESKTHNFFLSVVSFPSVCFFHDPEGIYQEKGRERTMKKKKSHNDERKLYRRNIILFLEFFFITPVFFFILLQRDGHNSSLWEVFTTQRNTYSREVLGQNRNFSFFFSI